ncbi:P-loop containing nucleoside triphosphate hydrolase protein [Gonapodya prolifera JEL478]|uniref:p-loop containing nucleoside triphosphate hydrolase protein n=1 Tax=Gonapodya prolifera (strain JEL478) TaxID=1344416 RepID=A0A139AAQ6_GONPJ|nr:P-loop containing nucleoside triphosphate hydrolase protein [Gonapodya prolifera JEL478]|eukprot:KXS13911.1 P-loop containing nucleoside triphosphate hydrolase protein [Gonapodya prolifera JEL478]
MARARPFGPLEPEEKALKVAEARSYQRELFERAKADNIIAVLDTGTGKTFIAAMLIKYVHECEELERIKDPDLPRKKTFFLVNLVPLVFQQAAFLEHNLHLSVGRYCSEMETAGERRQLWTSRIADHDVHVMTAQIFLNILVSGWIGMDQVSLLVFDEAHHAMAAHPYALVMRNFYMATPPEKRPRVFGMTASPAKRFSGGGEGVEVSLQDLALSLDSRIITSVDLTAVRSHAPRPAEQILRYHPSVTPPFPCTPLATALWSILTPFVVATHDSRDRKFFSAMLADAVYLLQDMGPWASDLALRSVLAEVIVRHNRYVGRARGRSKGVSPVVAEAIKVLARRFTGVVGGSNGIVWFELPWGKERAQKDGKGNGEAAEGKEGVEGATSGAPPNPDAAQQSALDIQPSEVAEDSNMAQAVSGESEPVVDTDADPDEEPPVSPSVADASQGHVSYKVRALQGLLMGYTDRREEFRGIIFVEKRTAATALAEILRKSMGEGVAMVGADGVARGPGWVKVGALVGHGSGNRDGGAMAARRVEMDFREQNRVIRAFKKGELNLLVATSVAEEGLDVQPCMLVVRYDLPKTHIAYIQSRGRARQKNSAFFFMVEAYNMEHTNLILELTARERQLRECLTVSSSADAKLEGLVPVWAKRLEARPQMEHDPELAVLSKVPGAVITIDQAVAALSRFCSKLPSDRFYYPRPDYTVEQIKEGDWTGALTLPSVLPAHLRHFTTPRNAPSKKEARQFVALVALKKLYEHGWLDDHFRGHVPGSEMFQAELRRWGIDGFEELLQQGLVEGQPHMNGVMVVSRVLVPKCWIPLRGLEMDDTGNRIVVKRKAEDDLSELTQMQPRVIMKKPKILEKSQRIRLDGVNSAQVDEGNGDGEEHGDVEESGDQQENGTSQDDVQQENGALQVGELDGDQESSQELPVAHEHVDDIEMATSSATLANGGDVQMEDAPITSLPTQDSIANPTGSIAKNAEPKVDSQATTDPQLPINGDGDPMVDDTNEENEPWYLGSGYAERRRVINGGLLKRRPPRTLLPPEVMEEHETWYLNIVEKNGKLEPTGFLAPGPLPVPLKFRLYTPIDAPLELKIAPTFDSFVIRTASAVVKATDLTTVQFTKLRSGEEVHPYVLNRNTMAQVRRYNSLFFGTMLKKSVEEQDLENPYLWLLAPVKEKPAENLNLGSVSFSDFDYSFNAPTKDSTTSKPVDDEPIAAAQLDRGMLHTFRRGYFNKRCALKDKSRYNEVIGRLVTDLAGYRRTYLVEEILSISPFDPLPGGQLLQHGKARCATVADYYEKAWKVERLSIQADQCVIRVSAVPKKIDFMRPFAPEVPDDNGVDEGGVAEDRSTPPVATVGNLDTSTNLRDSQVEAVTPKDDPDRNNASNVQETNQSRSGGEEASQEKSNANVVDEDTTYLLPQFTVTSPMLFPHYLKSQQFPSLLTLTHRYLGIFDFLDDLGFGNEFSEVDFYRFMLAMTPPLSPVPPFDPSHHQSEIHYERLETYGDGYLKVCLSTFLVVTHPTWFEGSLSKVRAQMQSNETLWKQGLRLKVHWERFVAASSVSLSRKNWEPLRHFIQREVPKKTIADTVEATIAAFLLSTGEDTARRFVELLYREAMKDGCFVNLPISVDSIAAEQHKRIVDLECREVMVGVTAHPKMALVPHVEKMFGYTFKRKELALMAVTHGSAIDTPVTTYERVEFLGECPLARMTCWKTTHKYLK